MWNQRNFIVKNNNVEDCIFERRKKKNCKNKKLWSSKKETIFRECVRLFSFYTKLAWSNKVCLYFDLVFDERKIIWLTGSYFKFTFFFKIFHNKLQMKNENLKNNQSYHYCELSLSKPQPHSYIPYKIHMLASLS